jgi:hypothetical protein
MQLNSCGFRQPFGAEWRRGVRALDHTRRKRYDLGVRRDKGGGWVPTSHDPIASTPLGWGDSDA